MTGATLKPNTKKGEQSAKKNNFPIRRALYTPSSSFEAGGLNVIPGLDMWGKY